MNIVGFDPGLNGSCAVLSRDRGIVVADDLPTLGEGTQRRIDAANLADLIREYGPYSLAVVEMVHAMPGNGTASMFRFGQAFGTILGVIGAVAIPVRLVTPSQWKKTMGLDSSAETSRARAIETWPHQASLFARKKDHNRAEAALLALWGATHGGAA
jgi:crossover junction endodeoxyribonuclease RuvC